MRLVILGDDGRENLRMVPQPSLIAIANVCQKQAILISDTLVWVGREACELLDGLVDSSRIAMLRIPSRLLDKHLEGGGASVT